MARMPEDVVDPVRSGVRQMVDVVDRHLMTPVEAGESPLTIEIEVVADGVGVGVDVVQRFGERVRLDGGSGGRRGDDGKAGLRVMGGPPWHTDVCGDSARGSFVESQSCFVNGVWL